MIALALGEPPEQTAFSNEALEQASEAFTFAATRVESILPKFAASTPQHTLAIRRLQAFAIAQALIGREQGA